MTGNIIVLKHVDTIVLQVVRDYQILGHKLTEDFRVLAGTEHNIHIKIILKINFSNHLFKKAFAPFPRAWNSSV